MKRRDISQKTIPSASRGPIVAAVGITIAYAVTNIYLLENISRLISNAANPFFAFFIMGVTCIGQLLTIAHVIALVRELKFASQVNAINVQSGSSPDETRERLGALIGKQPSSLAAAQLFSKLLRIQGSARSSGNAGWHDAMEIFQSGVLRRSTLPQYIATTLIGLGLFGTFLGLIVTLREVANLIGLFSVSGPVDSADLMGQFFQKLSGPLGGMGEAFVASLLGLGGSIINSLQVLALKKIQGNAMVAVESEFAETAETLAAGRSGLAEDGEADKHAGSSSPLHPEQIRELRRDIGRHTEAILMASSKMRQVSEAVVGAVERLQHIAETGEKRVPVEEMAAVLDQRLSTLARQLHDTGNLQASLLNVTRENGQYLLESSSHLTKLLYQASVLSADIVGVRDSVERCAELARENQREQAEQLQAAIHAESERTERVVAGAVKSVESKLDVLGDLDTNIRNTTLQVSLFAAGAQKTIQQIRPQIVEAIARLEKMEQKRADASAYDLEIFEDKVDELLTRFRERQAP